MSLIFTFYQMVELHHVRESATTLVWWYIHKYCPQNTMLDTYWNQWVTHVPLKVIKIIYCESVLGRQKGCKT